MVTVNLFGVFRVEAGKRSFLLDMPDETTVGKAIRQIVNLYPVLEKYWVDSNGGLSSHVLVTLNGEEIYTKSLGLQTPLKTGDRLDFFSPLAGG